MKVQIATAPTEEIMTLDQMKLFLRIDNEDEDSFLLSLMKVARSYIENVTGRAFMTQTWNYYIDEWPTVDYIELPFPRLRSVTSVKYTDYDDVQTTWAATEYDVDTISEPGRIVLGYGKSWPTATLTPVNAIVIQYICGYGTPDDVPETIKTAMKILVSDLYENRETVITGQTVNRIDTVDLLLMPYRTFRY